MKRSCSTTFLTSTVAFGVAIAIATIAPPSALAFESGCSADGEPYTCQGGPDQARNPWLGGEGPIPEHRLIWLYLLDRAGIAPADVPGVDVSVFASGERFEFNTEKMCYFDDGGREYTLQWWWNNGAELADDYTKGIASTFLGASCERGRCVDDRSDPVTGTCKLDFRSIDPTAFDEANRVMQRERKTGEFTQLPDWHWSLSDWARGGETCALQDLMPGLSIAPSECHEFAGHMGAANASHFPPQSQSWFRHYHRLALKRAAACKTMREAFPESRKDLQAFTQACDAQAMALEEIAQHYLQDTWSVGHMWQRWGSANPSDYRTYEGIWGDPVGDDKNGMVRALYAAAITGIIHGAESMLGLPDAMNSPTRGVGFHGHEGAHGPGIGDLYWKTLEDAPELKVQRDRLTLCGVSSLRAVWGALGRPLKPLDTEALGGADLLDLEQACFGQRVTNASLRRGMGVDLEHPSGGTYLGEPETLVQPLNPVVASQLTLVAGFTPLAGELKSEARALEQHSFWSTAELVTRVHLTALADPDGTQLAEGGIGKLVGVKPNGAYVTAEGELPAPYADPFLPWTPSPDAAARDEDDPGATALGKTFHRAHAAQWCDLFAEGDPDYDLNALKARVEATRTADEGFEGACGVCREFAQRAIRFGTGPAAYATDPASIPLCDYLATDPDKVQHIYVEDSCIIGQAPPSHLEAAAKWCGCPLAEFNLSAYCNSAGCSYADPRLVTHDGLGYPFQAVGEFTLVESTDATSPFLIQSRQQAIEPVAGAEAVCSNLTVNTAIAVADGSVSVTLTQVDEALTLRIGGEVVALEARQGAAAGCGYVWNSGDSYIISLGGSTTVVWPQPQGLGVSVTLGASRAGKVRGLLGDADGATDNDLVRLQPDGTTTVLGANGTVDAQVLYADLADSWRVTPENSVLYYEGGESPDTFADPGHPTTVAGPMMVEQAEAACVEAGVTDPGLLAWCAQDVACGGEGFAQVHADAGAPTEMLTIEGDLTAPNCAQGCAAIVNACQSLEAQQQPWASASECEFWCDAWNVGAPGGVTGDTLACRMSWLPQAEQDPEEHCAKLGLATLDDLGSFQCSDTPADCAQVCVAAAAVCPEFGCLLECEAAGGGAWASCRQGVVDQIEAGAASCEDIAADCP